MATAAKAEPGCSGSLITDVRDPNTGAIICCFPQCVSRELDGKQSALERARWDGGIVSYSSTGRALRLVLKVLTCQQLLCGSSKQEAVFAARRLGKVGYVCALHRV